MVQQAIDSLRAFGDIDRKTARKLLPLWSRYNSLSRHQVRQILKAF